MRHTELLSPGFDAFPSFVGGCHAPGAVVAVVAVAADDDGAVVGAVVVDAEVDAEVCLVLTVGDAGDTIACFNEPDEMEQARCCAGDTPVVVVVVVVAAC